MRIPDPEASRAVLIGSYAYHDLDPLPSVANNLGRLRQLFTSADLMGLPARNCTVLENPAGPAEVLDLIHQAALEATDTLLVYYAGHGLLDPRTDDLYLALPDSDVSRLYTGVRFEDLRRELVDVAGAAAKVVVLDCCYSGRAMLGGMSGSMEIADQARIEGTYLMTASAENVRAQAPIGEEFTAFTGELVGALEQGLPEGPDLLSVETLYWHVRKELVAKRRPVPQQRAGNDGGMIVLARNRRGLSSTVQTRPSRRVLPEPPAEFISLMRRPPREMVRETQRLHERDRDAVANAILAAAAARRPDQEVAAALALLRGEGRNADAALMISTAAQRPAADVLTLIEALDEIGLQKDLDEVIAAVAGGPAEDVGSLAALLRSGGRSDEVRRLLVAAIAAHQASEEVIELVGTLLSNGMADEVSQMLDVAAARLTSTERVALADALRGAGRDEAAFRLYTGALDVVAAEPPSAVASVLRAMRDGDRNGDAKALLEVVCRQNLTAPESMDLVSALWNGSLDADAGAVLEAAAARLNIAEAADLAVLLREVGRDSDALGMCVKAAAEHVPADTISLVAALRDAGRPVDGNRVLDSVRHWPFLDSAELILRLREAGADSDAQRVIKAVAQGEPRQFGQLVSSLRDRGVAGDAATLLAIASGSGSETVAALVAGLRSSGLSSDVTQILERYAERSPDEICRLLVLLRQDDLAKDAATLIRLVVQRGWADVNNLLPALRTVGHKQDSKLVAEFFAETFPVQEIVAHVEVLVVGGVDDVDGLVTGLTRRPLVDTIFIVDALRQTDKIGVKLLVPALSNRSDKDIIAALAEVADDLLCHEACVIIGSSREFLSAFTLARSMEAAGQPGHARRLLGTALLKLSVEETISQYKDWHRAAGPEDSILLLEAAATAAPVAKAAELVLALESVNFGFMRGPQRTKERVLAAFAAGHGTDDTYALVKILKGRGRHPEARMLENCVSRR